MALTTSSNKRIAKNTGFLYIRMFIIMAVQLVTARVVLDKLGASDYGLYNVVGGVVGMLGFLNATLGTSTSRYITYSLGEGDKDKLSRTFCTAFYTHLFLAVIVILVLETGGLWFLYNKLVIPPDRMDAAMWVYQFSLVTCFVSMTQLPYTSDIIAHEQMSIYAYVSIFEALAKLGVAYMISVTVHDRLIVYAFLLMAVQFIVAMAYRVYCIRHYGESRLHRVFDIRLFKELLGFSGWNLFANVSEMLRNQGVIILINMFFSSGIVAAQAVGNQISNAMMQFVNNIRTAVNPQIIKSYAAGDHKASKKLVIDSTIYVYDLLLLLGLPIILLMKPLLELWLVKVPPYTVVFAQFIIAQQIISNFNAASYTSLLAAKKVKNNSIAAVFTSIFQFGIMYVALKLGGGVMWVPWIGLLNTMVWAFLIRPVLLRHDADYTYKELAYCYWSCVKVTIIPLVILIPLRLWLNDTLPECCLLLVASIIVVTLSSLMFMEKNARIKLFALVRNKIQRKS